MLSLWLPPAGKVATLRLSDGTLAAWGGQSDNDMASGPSLATLPHVVMSDLMALSHLTSPQGPGLLASPRVDEETVSFMNGTVTSASGPLPTSLAVFYGAAGGLVTVLNGSSTGERDAGGRRLHWVFARY